MSRLFGDGWAPALAQAHGEARVFARQVVLHPWFERTIVTLIIVNAALLGLQTDAGFAAQYGPTADRIDTFILAIFVFEILLRILAHGKDYFRSAWSWFDMLVVGVSFAPASEGLSILRALRVLRLLRLLSVVPKMRRVIGGFFAAIPGMAGVVGVLSVVFYVSAVITTSVFGQATLADAPPGATAEDIATVQELFGTIAASFFTLFQLMTLEDWAGGIVKPTLAVFPGAMWFFGPYIVITSFAVLNLFIGIIVDAMQDDRDEEEGHPPGDPSPAAAILRPAPSHGSGHGSGGGAGRNPDGLNASGGVDPEMADMLLAEIRRLRAETRRLADLAETARADTDRLLAERHSTLQRYDDDASTGR